MPGIKKQKHHKIWYLALLWTIGGDGDLGKLEGHILSYLKERTTILTNLVITLG